MASAAQHSVRTSHKKSKRLKESRLSSEDPISHTSPKKVKIEDSKPQELVLSQKLVASSTASNATLGWETEELNTLINNLAKCLPKNDVAKFSTLVEKLDWEKVRFGGYSAQECKDKWFQVMSRLRRYRTLTDMVDDARVWLKAPWQTYNNAKKIKHPDLPKKPLTPFFRYFMEKREKTGKSHPGSSVTDLAKLLSSKFASLNERKKQKYKDSYDREYEEYKGKLEQFKREHPEVEFGSMNKQQSAHGHAQEGPHRPRTPQQLFMEEKLKKVAPNSEAKKESIERIRGLWSQLSEGKRIKWIRKALQDEQRYESEVLEYLKEHPSFEPNKLKSVLTKAEKELKDKFDGKPERPPNSGYSLFSKILLRELKNVPSKEKMVVIAKRWKELSETERNGYNREAQKAMTKYVEKFEGYLNSLPESERAKVLSENKLKLPSEKKLKQQQNLPKLQIPLQPEPLVEEDPRAKEHAALMCYQMERTPALQTKYPNKGKADILKMTLQEWNEKLNEKKKAKYYKLSDSFASFMPSTSKPQTLTSNKSANNKKPNSASVSFVKREPKRPPKSGYALYTSEQLSSLTNFEPKKRMTEIARKWNHEISKLEKENYDTRAKELAVHYQRDLTLFKATLTPSELEQYHTLQSERAKPKPKAKSNKSSKTEMDPVVDDSNVIETIDVSTSGNAIVSSEESNSDSESNSDEEEDEPQHEQQPQQQSAQQQSSESEESESESEDDEDGSDSDNSDSEYE